MSRKVLVPLDGSPFAEQALPLALGVARRTGAELQLLLVDGPMEVVYPEHRFLHEDAWATEWKTQHRRYLDDLANRLRAATSVTVSPFILEGDVADTIQKHAVDHQADLVVMTTHVRGALARMWLGGVADRLVRELPRPILLVRPSDQPVDPTRETAVKQVLIPLDGTPLAEQVLETALPLGGVMGAEFTLLRVIRPLPLPNYPAEGIATGAAVSRSFIEQLERTQTELRTKAEDYLDEVAQRLRKKLLRVHVQVAADVQPAVAIIEAARRIPADLIAMQTHGRRGIVRMMLGSVADKVLRGASVPVLLQRP